MKTIKDLFSIFSSKCKYASECDLYAKDSATCNENSGAYYEGERVAGCYIENEKKHRSKIIFLREKKSPVLIL